MKKFAIGCAIVLVLLLVAGSIGGYLLYKRFVGPMAEFVTNIQKVADIEKEVKNTSSFTAPDNGELTEEMVARFVKAQTSIQGKLGKKMESLKGTYDKIEQAQKAEGRDTSVSEGMGALRDLASLFLEGKKAQVEAMNQNGFSMQEYEWVRTQVYAAVGVVAAGFDLKKIAEQAKDGNVESLQGMEKGSLPDVPGKNKELVAPYEKQLKEWAPLAFFGF
jgi:hypothetical protein